MTAKNVLSLFSETFSRWNNHNAQRLGAALAFYSLLSLAPLVVFLLALVSVFFQVQSVSQRIQVYAETLMGPIAGDTIAGLIQSTQKPVQGIVASIIATATLLVGASAVFGELKDSLDIMWNLKSRFSGLRGMVAQKIFSFLLVVSAGFLLLLSMLATAAFTIVGRFFGNVIPIPGFVLQAINFAVSFLVFVAVFYLIFRFVPDLVLPWQVLLIGSSVSAFLFVIGKTLLGLYLGWAGAGSAYGAAGSLVAIAVWVYYSAQIFLFGAEFTNVIAEARYPEKIAAARS